MSKNWESIVIADLVEKICVGFVGTCQKYYCNKEQGVPMIRTTNLTERNISLDDTKYISYEFHKKNKKSQLKRGDILIARHGDNGKACMYNLDIPANCLNVVIVRPDGKKVNPKFFLYQFNSHQVRSVIESMSSGSVQDVINTKQISQIELLIPNRKEQDTITSVLSSLDDKIDLLHRQNATLEALAEMLFRQWFVEEAKEDWENGILDDVISVKGGTTPSTKESKYWNGNIHWTSPRDLSNHTSIFLFDTDRKITKEGLSQISSGLLPIGTVLLSSRAPIGYLAINEIPVAINQGYIAIICNKIISNYFIYLWCKLNMPDIENAANGSVFQEIVKSVFKQLPISIPPKSKLDDFDKTVEPLFLKIKTNQTQIRTLTALRDSLLPKLMSGEVRVEV